jgi:predicted amidohydrolase YtcJ
MFFIDTSTGQVATGRQLVESGVADADAGPQPPWFRIQGSGDATTLWYAVMRKRTRGVHIGALCIRHSDHHASLLNSGWEEVPVDQIRAETI